MTNRDLSAEQTHDLNSVTPDETISQPVGLHGDDSFLLIGIGASAGGLDAIKLLLSGVPENCAHSFVIIQHLSPEYKSMMSDILSRETSLEVVEVEDAMPIEPGRIYLIPPKWNVVIQGTMADPNALNREAVANSQQMHFALIQRSSTARVNYPVDLFFQSLAEANGDRSVGVILSGTGSDGTLGLRAIKEHGGIVLAQDPRSAAFDGMPMAAIDTRLVDIVVQPNEIVDELVRYFEDFESGRVETLDLDEQDTVLFSKLLAQVSEAVSINFAAYKEGTIKRRTARRIKLSRSENLSEYMQFVSANPDELQRLAQDFLVGSTAFFRDRPAWETLYREVIPKLFEEGDPQEPVKLWTPACSTGQETYSIALMLAVYRLDNNITRDFRIIATDVNSIVVDAARHGAYPLSEFSAIPEKFRRKEFMHDVGGMLKFKSALQKHIVFAKHNALLDPPYIRTDLVICRNLLIYLMQDLQQRLMTIMSFSLRQDGYLFLGIAEHVERGHVGFSPLHPEARLYINDQKPPRLSVQRYFQKQFIAPQAPEKQYRPEAKNARVAKQLPDLVLRSLAMRAGACVLVIDQQNRIIQSYGAYRDYLDLPDQAFSANISDLLPAAIRNSVLLLIKRTDIGTPSERLGLVLPKDNVDRVVDVFCEVHNSDTEEPTTMLTFVATDMVIAEAAPARTGQQSSKLISEQAEMIQRLEVEISEVKSMLVASNDELGTLNGQMQTANEELIMTIEELQASNEELQSTNEELHTVNAENADRITEIETANNDIENLLDNAEFAILLLDGNLRIRRFSKGFSRFIPLVEADVGRSVSTFNSSMTGEAMARLLADCSEVLKSGVSQSRYVDLTEGGQGYSIIKPFDTRGGEEHGVSIKLFDRTELQHLRREVQRQRDRLESLIESDTSGYWDWQIPSNNQYYSPRFKEMLGYAPDELADVPETWHQLTHPDDLETVLEAIQAHFDSKGAIPLSQEMRFIHRDGSIKWVMYRGHVVEWDDDGKPVRMMGVNIDITTLKQREEEIREVRRFAFIAAHDLMQPANTIQSSLMMLIDDYSELLEGEPTQLIDFATSAASRLKARIGAILDYSRLGGEQLSFETVDLGDVTRSCIDDLQAQLQDSKAQVTIGPLPKALGAPTLLIQVVQNLLSNAMKYRHKDHECRIEVAEVNAPEDMVAIAVTDNGIGIPFDRRRQVFDLFARLHSEDDYSGSGVGLSLCERLVTQHGGRIWIEDGHDGGVSFVFTLKAAQDL